MHGRIKICVHEKGLTFYWKIILKINQRQGMGKNFENLTGGTKLKIYSSARMVSLQRKKVIIRHEFCQKSLCASKNII